MSEEKELKQFYRFLRPNQCYKCGGQIVTITNETIFNKLDDQGIPSDTHTIVYPIRAYCTNCGEFQGFYEENFHEFSYTYDRFKYLDDEQYTELLTQNIFGKECDKKCIILK